MVDRPADAPPETSPTLDESLADPQTAQRLTGVGLLLLSVLALQLRRIIDVPDGVLDIDTVNFGLSALRFDLQDHQPHPPGYPGYVVFLQALHGLVGAWSPLELAKWGSRILGVLTVPAAWWACRLVLPTDGLGPAARVTRPLLAGLLAALHPLLWYYGGDGQSHAAEALGTLLLFGLTVVVQRRGRLVETVLLVALFGLFGSLRPTLALLNGPLLVWALWRRPPLWWGASAVAGLAAVAAWYLPLVAASGGAELYQRTTASLVQDLYVDSFSLFGGRGLRWRTLNAWMLALGLGFALSPMLGWSRRAGSGAVAWRRCLWAIVAANVAFYGLLFISEPGYVIGLAALACLVPASWPASLGPLLQARAAAALIVPPLLLVLGPSELRPTPKWPDVWLPTLSRVVEVDVALEYLREVTCPLGEDGGVLVVTDNSVVTQARLLPVVCPGVLVGSFLLDKPYNPDLDNWIVYLPDALYTLPTEVPLETGPGVRGTLPRPVARVAVGVDASEGLARDLAALATCPPVAGGDRWPETPLVWPAACLSEITLGSNTLVVPAP